MRRTGTGSAGQDDWRSPSRLKKCGANIWTIASTSPNATLVTSSNVTAAACSAPAPAPAAASFAACSRPRCRNSSGILWLRHATAVASSSKPTGSACSKVAARVAAALGAVAVSRSAALSPRMAVSARPLWGGRASSSLPGALRGRADGPSLSCAHHKIFDSHIVAVGASLTPWTPSPLISAASPCSSRKVRSFLTD
eukprot:SAG31_NODE_2858_length_4991_cov_1.806827_2_plen_197_part_00